MEVFEVWFISWYNLWCSLMFHKSPRMSIPLCTNALASLNKLPSFFAFLFQAATQALHPFHQRDTQIQRGGRCWKRPLWSIFPLQVCLWAIHVLRLCFGCWLCTCILQCHNTCCKPKSTAVPRKADQYSFSSIISYTFALLEGICFLKSCILRTTTNLDLYGVSLQDVFFAIGHLLYRVFGACQNLCHNTSEIDIDLLNLYGFWISYSTPRCMTLAGSGSADLYLELYLQDQKQ